MLRVENLHVSVGDKEVLSGIDLHIDKGEILALFGPNGSGKTSLLMAIMGMSGYRITEGRILFKDREINDLSIDERAKLGIGMLFQRPPVVRGVKTKQMVGIAARGKVDAEKLASRVNLASFLERDVNLGFSGGEIKRSELLQLLAQSPDLVLLDEPESGVDLENVRLVGTVINELLEKQIHRTRRKAGLIITHTGHILDYVDADRGCVLLDRRIACSANPRDILRGIRAHGYEQCAACKR